ncbi:PREDICTED: phosphoinositide 3-kinase adapter protein 1 [Ceratosolen solmsi marchali]|uniref:Phosphoinositide 3-kinase adapter protein 1 n=1 Tax=Ceratosolen solmsi marchali TaxID=326594 RepID=A0AAJ7DX36_9HYME|nr:PREDICTED: phosphoinositide 3-kinase adapter protein 1 [Ceratosolen solmsi marchali]
MSGGSEVTPRPAEATKRPDFLDLSGNCPRTRHAPGPCPGSKPQDTIARDDVIFISSKDDASTLWVNYLTASFEQISRQQGRPPFRVSQITFEDPLLPGTDFKIRNSRLQIIVVCPVFLERAAERPEHAATISRQLSTERVLAMMLGVQDIHLNMEHRAALVTYPSWRKFFVKDQDETFVGQFLGAAVAILGTAIASNLKNDKTAFSVHPKKVKLGQSRVIALLNEPLQTDDNVTVIVDRCGEAIEVGHVKRRNPYTLQFSIPDRCLEVSMLVGVRIACNGAPLGVRQVKCESRLRELDQILRAHDNPLEFMCQTFGFNSGDKEQLDNWMVHSFQKNIPPHFNLLSNPTNDLQLSKNHSSSEENPTLLHFAARFGLEKLAWQLLECPGGDVACDMKNANDFTPADLSEQAGHVRLAHQLRGYMQMNEFSNMYSYLKVMSENTNGNANGFRASSHQSERLTTTEEEPRQASRQEDYCRPRPLSEAYSVPPMARPVPITSQQQHQQQRTFPDYSTPPPLPLPNSPVAADSTLAPASSTTTLDPSGLELPLQGYMQMNPTGFRSPDSSVSTPTGLSSSQLITQRSGTETPTNDVKGEYASSDQLSSKSSLGRSSQSSNRSRECPQDELLEIITDFKNNVFTISEVERLVENWRNRNDVQQSFRDKQRQLSAMRDEYERIQKRMKDEMKAPTPFDRIRKFFTKGKKELKDSMNVNEDLGSSKQNCVGNLADRRPVSSLSLHSVSSSSSSGRMSTVSGCSGTSLGDSGTHSDTEDRRLQHPASDDKVVGITSYEIPPAPKPFHTRLQQQTAKYAPGRVGCTSVNNSELDLRAVKSSHPTADDKEYYISFPPSGLPVHSFKAHLLGNVRELKTPNSPIDMSSSSTIHDLDGSGNYANISPILKPPPGLCIPFEYENVSGSDCHNILTIQPEIHAEPRAHITKTETLSNLPDYTNVQVAASEEIAKNFGVTLKKLPGPPVPPRCEFNFASKVTDE